MSAMYNNTYKQHQQYFPLQMYHLSRHIDIELHILVSLCWRDYVTTISSIWYRTKSASGPKPVPLLPRNREEYKENHTVLKIRILYANCLAIQYTTSKAWSPVTENFFQGFLGQAIVIIVGKSVSWICNNCIVNGTMLTIPTLMYDRNNMY